MSLPEVEIVRKRIEKTQNLTIRNTFKLAYLTAARIGEIVGNGCPNDTTKPIGPNGKDVRLANYNHHRENEEVAVFTILTEKRGGIPRKIALPLNPDFEPWTKQLVEYFNKRGEHKAFPINRQQAWRKARKTFKSLQYPIEQYKIFENGKIIKTKEPHPKPFGTHALRHVRTTELIDIYGFDGFDLSIYCGWTMRSTMPGATRPLERYAHLQWRKYFPKLLLRRE